MNPRNRVPKKKLAMAYIVNGLMAQLMNRVRPTGRIALPALQNFAEVDLDHDRIHHEEQAQRNRNRNDGSIVDIDRHAVECLGEARCQLSQSDPGHDAQSNPEREVSLEKAHSLAA